MRYFFLWLVLPFMVALSFYGIFRIWGKMQKYLLQIFRHYFNSIATVKSLQSSRLLQTTLQTPINEMPSLNRNDKVTFENCGTQTTKLYLARHKKRCSVGTLYCTQCPNFSTKSQSDLNYHIAKRHSAPKPDTTFRCKLCLRELPGFYATSTEKHSTRNADLIRNKRCGCGT